MSILPENTMKLVDTEFKTRQSRAVALELLTSWRKMPSWKEKEAIGERHGRNVKTVHEISMKLQELELFTADHGSMYLYRIGMEKQQAPVSGVEDLPERTESSKIMTELPAVSPAGYTLEDDPITIDHPSEGIKDDFGALKNKVFRMEADLKGIDKKLGMIIPAVQGLSAKKAENQTPQVTAQKPKAKDHLANPDSVEDLMRELRETLNRMQAANAVEPEVAVADSDAIIPSMDVETENPLEATTEDVIELEGSIISKKTVGFTPKSLMLFDLTRKKGFRGNFADFVNSCISSALKGRKFKLTVEEDVE